MNLETVKSVYRSAIDAHATDAEGDDWWLKVAKEIDAVIAAPSTSEAARIIVWWHHDWAAVCDSPVKAAARIRRAAARNGINRAAARP